MIRAILAGVAVGDGLDPRVMGAINVSPESFYDGSVALGEDRLLAAAARMVEAGASLIDIGAMSTAPYLDTAIPPAEEAARLGRAVRLIVSSLDVPVSADTSRAEAARAALEAGARVINDVSGLRADPALATAVAQAGAALIVVASPPAPGEGATGDAATGHVAAGPVGAALAPGRAAEARPVTPAAGAGGSLANAGHAIRPISAVRELLAASLCAAIAAGIDLRRVAVDPGIGFFRRGEMAWYEWDCRILAALPALRELGRPICVGASRKSFIGALTGQADPSERLPGSLAATAAAVLGGAHLIRAHDVAETVQAVQVAAAIRRASAEAPSRQRSSCR